MLLKPPRTYLDRPAHSTMTASNYACTPLDLARDAAMNGMRRRIAGKTPSEIREMSKDAMKEPVTQDDFLQVMTALIMWRACRLCRTRTSL